MTKRQADLSVAGTVLPLSRSVPGAVDPLALYAALSDGGRRPGTFLFESGDFAAGVGERSILGVGAALHLRADGRTVTISATSPNGESMLPWVATQLAASASTRHAASKVIAEYPAPATAGLDERARAALPSPLDALRVVATLPTMLHPATDLAYLIAGIWSYDLVELFEQLPPGRAASHITPLFEFVVPDRLIIIDHAGRESTIVAHAFGGEGGAQNHDDADAALAGLCQSLEAEGRAPRRSPNPPNHGRAGPAATTDISDSEFAELVVRLKQHIVAGDVFQVVASRTFSAPCPDPLRAYTRLRADHPSPYLFYVVGGEATLFGASPETAVQVRGMPRTVTVRPIAGTAARGRTPDGEIDRELDGRCEARLRLDQKEVAEHMMLVDLARNDVARVSRPGTRMVTRLLDVERHSHVMHLVSEVTGELAPGQDALHAYAATLNMGTLVGAPKVRAAQLLREHEATRRGWYGGAVGYFTHTGELDSAIVIRAAVVRDGTAHVRAGAGIVHDSIPEREAEETRLKSESVLAAIRACGGASP